MKPVQNWPCFIGLLICFKKLGLSEYIIFTDNLYLGGTLGLFVGVSIMTGIEIVMWILHLIYAILFLPTENVADRKRRKY
jgi:uncharacterized membrane protein